MALVIIVALAAAVPPLRADSPQCDQARLIVADLQRRLSTPQPDHVSIGWTLATARSLCSSLGEAWALSHCNAIALDDREKAVMFGRQARFLGVEPDCGSGAAPAGERADPLPAFVRDKYALVVGIGSFRDPRIPRLRFAAKDARDLVAILTDPRVGRFHPDKVTLLIDAEATRAGILNAIQDLFVRAREDDLVLLYLSSHGSPRREDDGLGGVGYLVTHDTSLESIWLDAIDYQGFSRQAALIRARRKVIFIDTCYSGLALGGEKTLSGAALGVDEQTAALFVSGEGTYVVTSSRGNERSFESEALENSYFTYYLLRALQQPGNAPDLSEVFDFIARAVPEAVARDRRSEQHPQIVPADGLADLKIGVLPLVEQQAPSRSAESGG